MKPAADIARSEKCKAQREAWRAAGRCILCGRPRAPGFVCCERHVVASRARNRRRYRARREAQLCVARGAPAENGGMHCSEHRALQQEASRRHHRGRKPLSKMAAVLRNARSRAVAAGREFSIEVKDLLPLPERCPVLGIELLYCFAGKKGPRSASPSIDRINNALGYVKGNVRIISARANRIRNDATPDELRAILRDAEMLAARAEKLN